MTTIAPPSRSTALTHQVVNFAGRDFGRIDLLAR